MATDCVKGAVGLVELRAIGVVVDYYQDLVQFLHLQLLGRLRDLALLLDDAVQCRLVPLVPVGPSRPAPCSPPGPPRCAPAVVDVNARAEDVDSLEDASILNQADQRHGLARFQRPEEDAGRLACWCTRSWGKA